MDPLFEFSPSPVVLGNALGSLINLESNFVRRFDPDHVIPGA